MSFHTTYLRAWLWSAGLVITALLLALLLVSGLNAARERAFNEHYPAPILKWLAMHPDAISVAEWLDQSMVFNLLSTEELEYDAVAFQRLAWGQVLADYRGDGIWLRKQVDEGLVLEVWFREPYRDVAELTGLVVAWSLDRTAAEARADLIDSLSDALATSVVRMADQEIAPHQDVLEQLVNIGFAYHQAGEGQPAVVFVRLEDGEIYRIHQPDPFDPWAWPVSLTLAVLLAGTLAVLVVLVYGRLQQHMRTIENAVSRIARGELDARVSGGKLQQLTRLDNAFNGMAEHIQRLVHVQREMIHAVSHELRTPVARIRFGVQMIEDCPDPVAVRKQLAGIDADIQELDELIDEILTYARLEQGGPILAVQESDMERIVQQVVGEQKVTRQGLNIHAVFEGESAFWRHSDVESRYIHRAIQNLVGNATRYAISEVLVRCRFEKDTCRIDVEDDGAGIPEQDWERIFTPFARLDDSRTRKSGGYGLGLSIVRRILYWHGGQAFVGRSAALGGACFSLVWPRKQG